MTVQECPEGRLSQTLQEKHIKKLLHSRDTGKAPACSVFKAVVCLATAGLGLVCSFFSSNWCEFGSWAKCFPGLQRSSVGQGLLQALPPR